MAKAVFFHAGWSEICTGTYSGWMGYHINFVAFFVS